MIALFFDTETTGVKSWKDPDFKPGLVQLLTAILQDTESKRILAEINLIVNQDGKPIPPEVTAIHGINDELADRFGISLVGIDALFARLIRMADTLVAHNIDFDLDVVRDNLPAAWRNMAEMPTFCTMDQNVMIVKAPLSDKQKSYFTSKGEKPDRPYKVPNLQETYRHYFGKGFDGAHDAMVDIRACRDIYFAMEMPS